MKTVVNGQLVLLFRSPFFDKYKFSGLTSLKFSEEETIEALFASGYSQAKQTTGPVHVVELNSIPPELRSRAGLA